MGKMRWAAGLLTASLLLLTAGAAWADRVPSEKVEVPRDPGARGDIAVPVTTNGFGNLGVYQGVAVRIYATPVVNAPHNPGARPVYNLPFYGGSQAFGWGEGVVSRPKSVVPH
ncbi:MAG TPA: hypothetical protein VMS17_18865 [Gemmataceae bacterium]|nr:hypothetical protein [Gemmataceae bacterium]